MVEPTNHTPQMVYERLMADYGPQGWWPVTDPGAGGPGRDPEGRRGRPPMLTPGQQWEIMVGAILTQNTAWSNVLKALAGLCEAGFDSLASLAQADREPLATAIRSSGYFNQKAKRLQLLARFLMDEWRGDIPAFLNRPTSSVRDALLTQKGIGPETADCILLYGGNGNHPVFVVDGYTYRLAERLGWKLPARDYQAHQEHFMARLEPEVQLYNEYHALIVEHGKAHCKARDPGCAGCPLLDQCPTGQAKL